jgi:hypothetical protein
VLDATRTRPRRTRPSSTTRCCDATQKHKRAGLSHLHYRFGGRARVIAVRQLASAMRDKQYRRGLRQEPLLLAYAGPIGCQS